MLKLISVNLKKVKIETLIIPVCEDKRIHDNPAISLLIDKALQLKEFTGKKDDEVIFYDLEEVKAKRVVLIGLGKLEKIDPEALRAFAGKAVKKCMKINLSEVLLTFPCGKNITTDIASALEAMMEGAFLGNHVFNKYKKEKKIKPLKKINLLVKTDMVKEYGRLSTHVSTVCTGTILAREWVSTPSNDKKPEQFAKSIVTLAEKEKLKVSVLDEKELKEKKFGAMLAVGAGSNSNARMIVLEYSPKGSKKTVALVGKGVTFDSGGINLKPTGSLEDMKIDMSGGAAVAATLITIAKLKPKIKVIGIIPIVENMPSGSACRPGDIVKSYDGKTVEIGNTDAEGRLILIDALSFCIKKYKPHTVIDIATLTGACVVALGEKIAGVLSFDDKLAKTIELSGKKIHERCWNLPMPDDYKELLKSDLADIKNISSSRWGGAITAALFLSEFVGDTRWAHIDIAGPASIKKEHEYCGAGGTGFGVRLFCDLLDKL
ncbi:MAG: leucyl aminopeptidase [Deltaproteobacteria bacterium]|nr:leucyl aminopeptidase [Deltaproteobacteria bacterium]MBW2661240.1 leucyl aminopeptidase [Deltaproteobacteria bacterium]